MLCQITVRVQDFFFYFFSGLDYFVFHACQDSYTRWRFALSECFLLSHRAANNLTYHNIYLLAIFSEKHDDIMEALFVVRGLCEWNRSPLDSPCKGPVMQSFHVLYNKPEQDVEALIGLSLIWEVVTFWHHCYNDTYSLPAFWLEYEAAVQRPTVGLLWLAGPRRPHVTVPGGMCRHKVSSAIVAAFCGENRERFGWIETDDFLYENWWIAFNFHWNCSKDSNQLIMIQMMAWPEHYLNHWWPTGAYVAHI